MVEPTLKRLVWLEYSFLLSVFGSRVISVAVAGFPTFTPVQIEGAPLLVPTFEMLLRSCDVHEDVITAFRECTHLRRCGPGDRGSQNNMRGNIWHRHDQTRTPPHGRVGKRSQCLDGVSGDI